VSDLPERLRTWLAVLDTLTYYQVLGADFSDERESIQDAFHRFAETFHPDAHSAAPEAERQAAHVIFKRGVEAYRVLSDERLRAMYDDLLGEGDVRPAVFSSMLPPPEEVPEGEVDETTLALAARPFARRAEELARSGDFAQARLYVDLALFHDPRNARLLAYKGWVAKQKA